MKATMRRGSFSSAFIVVEREEPKKSLPQKSCLNL
jgi:hypothetical protein